MEHNRTRRHVEGPLSELADHVGDELIHPWLMHGKKATQPHTERGHYNRGIVYEINMQTREALRAV